MSKQQEVSTCACATAGLCYAFFCKQDVLPDMCRGLRLVRHLCIICLSGHATQQLYFTKASTVCWYPIQLARVDDRPTLQGALISVDR